MNLDLRKQLVLDLKKEKGIDDEKASVKLCLDYSGSMIDMYKSGQVDELIERILPVALAFDDDGELELYLFSNSVMKVDFTVNASNYKSGISGKLLKKYAMGGTSYSPPITKIVQDHRLQSSDLPAFVPFITDGANDDASESKKAMIEASNYPVFFQFVGIGSARFPFLEKLDTLDGRIVDNASFIKAADINSIPDKDLYSALLGEYPQWLKESRAKGITK